VVSRFLLFASAGEQYALPIERVREVVGWEEPRSLGAPAPWLLGVIALRGELIQVADLALRLGRPAGERRRIVVFDSPEGPAGLAVDEVDAVADVEDASVQPAPPGSGEAIAGIAARGSELVIVLDADSLLGPKPPPPRRRRASPRKPSS
jgi:purine-binding chemotaxis protein CheW